MTHEFFMSRCLGLASLGAGYVAPNPMVGAVLIHDDKIIGEGWHHSYGQPHAEVNCIADAIQKGFAENLDKSTLYVSLEPCSHFGKTPPCTDLIIKNQIPRVIIGCRDPFTEVNGRGIEKLKTAGIKVEVGILEEQCKELNKRFITFYTEHRPYIILKWAQTSDSFMAGVTDSRLLISNEYSNRLVHKWRSEEASILVGTNTALLDDPALNVRLWPGPSPVRLVVDMDLKLPESLKIFVGQQPTIIFNTKIHSEERARMPSSSTIEGVGMRYYQVTRDLSLVHQIMRALYQLKIQSVLVEGGAKLLQSFIDEGTWDEVRIVSNTQLKTATGLPAPHFARSIKVGEYKLLSDQIEIYKPV